MAGRRRHVDDGQPVRPTAWKNYPKVEEGDVCEVEDGRDDVFGCRAEEQNHDGGDHERAAEGEGLIPRIKKVVKKPTAEEVDRHMATHIPFRDWCPHCVAGKSKTDHKEDLSEDEGRGCV